MGDSTAVTVSDGWLNRHHDVHVVSDCSWGMDAVRMDCPLQTIDIAAAILFVLGSRLALSLMRNVSAHRRIDQVSMTHLRNACACLRSTLLFMSHGSISLRVQKALLRLLSPPNPVRRRQFHSKCRRLC